MSLTWLSVDARTGIVLADLPYLIVSTVKRGICRYESASASLPLPTAPDNWQLATRECGANMILLSDDIPVWGGMVTQVKPNEGDELPMALATLESYLDRRYVGDVVYAQVGQNAIVADLVARFVTSGARGGIPLRVVITDPGTLRDRTYTDASDKTIYSVMTELSAIEGGVEWTIEWEHLTDPERYTPVLYVGARIGTSVTAGLAPAATFDLPGCITAVEVTRDYSASNGANVVVATSSAVADVRPQSPAQVAPDDGRPTFEYRWTPSTSITEIGTLTSHAASALASLAPGAVSITMTANMGSAPRLGVDWVLGDDIGYSLGGDEDDPRMGNLEVWSDTFVDTFVDTFGGDLTHVRGRVNPHGRPSVPAFPNGLSGVARCIGWSMDLGMTPTITPILEGS